MVPLATAFVRAGHPVAWAAAPDVLPALDISGVERFPVGMDTATSRRIYRQRWPEVASLRGEALSAHTFPRLFGGVMAPAMLDNLVAAIDRWHPDLVINEAGALAAPLACRLRQVRHVTHAFGLRLPADHLAAAMRELAPSWERARLQAPEDGDLYRHLYLDIAPPTLQRAVADTEAVSSQALRPVAMGAPSRSPLPPDVVRALESARGPVIYLSFGTVFNRSETLRTAAAALARLEALVVITLGVDGELERWGGLPPNVHVARYLDQNALLPLCDAVVSHGGAGTLLGAAAHGLPQLVLPQAADQFRNARALVAAAAGACVLPDECTADRIEHEARLLIRSSSRMAVVKRLAEEIAAMPSAERVVSALVRS